MSAPLDGKLKITSAYLLREIAGTWVAIPTGTRVVEFSRIINLNESAAWLWRRLETGATESELLDDLSRHFDISAEQAESDVKSFLFELKEKGLLA